jgi:hypothetical protein
MKAMTTWTKKSAIYFSIGIIVLAISCSIPAAFLDEFAPVDIDDHNNTD